MLAQASDVSGSAAPQDGAGHQVPSRIARRTFVAVSAILLPLMMIASLRFGVTWDEKIQHRYGELVWEFLHGVGNRSDFESFADIAAYGGLFDTLCAAVEQYVPLDRYVVRHLLGAFFGWLGILYSGRLSSRLFGRWAGVLAMVMLAVSPRYFADSMNNPKDLPFAALTVAALYYFARLSPAWPYFSWKTVTPIILFLALALNVRAGALLYIGYLGILVAALVVAERNLEWRQLAWTCVHLLLITAAILLLGTIVWPWAGGSPFIRPVIALIKFANVPHGGLVLFDGGEYVSSTIPRSYAPWWLLISTPPLVLLGIALSLVASRGAILLRQAALWTVVLLPLVAIIVKRAPLYDGMRHLLFIYPILVVIAASGWASVLSGRQRPWIRWGAGVALVLAVSDILTFNVRAFPNQGVYFNRIVGGPAGAFTRYDMDYWGNCMLEAVSWSADTARGAGVPVGVSGNPWHLVQLNAERFRELSFTMPQRGEHQLEIRLNRGPIEGVKELAGRSDALYRVRTPDGVVLCAVFPGPKFSQLKPRLTGAMINSPRR